MVIILLEIFPRFGNLVSTISEIYSIKDQINKVSGNYDDIDLIASENKEIKNIISAYLSDDKEAGLSEIVDYLNQSAIVTGTDLISIKPGKAYAVDNLNILQIDLELEASYEDMYNFLRKLEFGEKIIKIKEFSIFYKKFGSQKLTMESSVKVYINL